MPVSGGGFEQAYNAQAAVDTGSLLVVTAGSIDRDDDKLQASMRANMEWINRNLSANGLTAA